MIGPRKRPQDFGFNKGDHHLVVNDAAEVMKAFDHTGYHLWTIPALARGQGLDYEWQARFSDTPPSLYRIGKTYNDFALYGVGGQDTRDTRAFGWAFFDLIDLEGREDGSGRAGIGIHGGGSRLGFPRCWDPFQPLLPTMGCIRIHNIHCRDNIFPLLKTGTVYVSVYQEQA